MTNENKKMYLSPPHMCGREIKLVNDAFASNWVAPVGPDIDAFENDMCKYTGASAAVALTSGTAAIHLALILNDVGENDEVLCSTFTFAGSAFPILYQRAKPVFIDCETKSWNMDPELLVQAIKDRIKINKKPKACIVVHLYGITADLGPIVAICEKYGIPLIEDAAESLGSMFGKVHTGTIGDFGVYSFNGNKIITTSGGGMLVAKDKSKIDKARYLATQARDPLPYYEHSTTGYNYRMSNIVAAIGCGQMSVIEERVKKKRAIYDYYLEQLHGVKGINLMPRDTYGRGNCWLTCIENCGKVSLENIRLALEAENIEARPLWKPMHLQPVFKGMPAYVSGVSERLFSTGLCLPSGTAMEKDDMDRVVSVIMECH